MRDRRGPASGRQAAGIVGALLALLAACSAGDQGATPGAERSRRITEGEAVVLADLLRTNLEAGGADVHAEVPFGTASFDLDGEIDWANRVGRLTVQPSVPGSTSASFDVVFNQTVVFEEVPGLGERLAERGAPRASWIARALDPTRSPLDVVVGLIDTAASTTRDNPVLLQSRDVRHLRRDRIGRTDVDVFRDGRTTYWVRRDDPILMRLDAELESTSSMATITFSNWGARTITTPEDTDVVSLDAVRDLYEELRRPG